jgi:hypothetical protein
VPELFAAVPLRRRGRRTLAVGLQADAWIRDIAGPFTVPVIVQYIELRQQVQQVALVPGSQDRLVWRWCASGCYSANSAHKFLFQGQKGVLGAKELWKVRAPNKCRFFLWLVLHQLCWTSEGLHRHALHDDGAAPSCTTRRWSLCTMSAGARDFGPPAGQVRRQPRGMVAFVAPLWLAPSCTSPGLQRR